MKSFPTSGQRLKYFPIVAQLVNAGLYGFGEALAELVDGLKNEWPGLRVIYRFELRYVSRVRALKPQNRMHHGRL